VRYLTVPHGEDSTAEIEVSRSRFLAVVRRVDDEAAGQHFLAQQRALHHSARHHCSAWRIGAEADVERSHDDGEPSGTAGKPILGVLRGAGLSDVAAVVTRYFGGTLLGAGGLARAYAAAALDAIETAPRVERRRLASIEVELARPVAARLEPRLREAGIVVDAVRYGGEVATMRLATEDLQELRRMLAAWLSAEPRLSQAGSLWIDRRL
jgi:uncharacterized YigZ family protein